MRIRGMCFRHGVPLELARERILFPTTSREPSRSPEGWYELDQSEMNCPNSHGECNTEWGWEIRS